MKFVRTLLYDGREVYICKLLTGAELCVAKVGFMKWDWSVDLNNSMLRQIVDDVPLGGRTFSKFTAEDRAVSAWAKATANWKIKRK